MHYCRCGLRQTCLSHNRRADVMVHVLLCSSLSHFSFLTYLWLNALSHISHADCLTSVMPQSSRHSRTHSVHTIPLPWWPPNHVEHSGRVCLALYDRDRCTETEEAVPQCNKAAYTLKIWNSILTTMASLWTLTRWIQFWTGRRLTTGFLVNCRVPHWWHWMGTNPHGGCYWAWQAARSASGGDWWSNVHSSRIMIEVSMALKRFSWCWD